MFFEGFMDGFVYARAREVACKAEADRQQKEFIERNKFKMTREEAVKIVRKIGNEKPWYEADIAILEALGLLKFEEKKVEKLFEACDLNGAVVRLETWPEGMVLWRAGRIVYKSWEKV